MFCSGGHGAYESDRGICSGSTTLNGRCPGHANTESPVIGTSGFAMLTVKHP